MLSIFIVTHMYITFIVAARLHVVGGRRETGPEQVNVELAVALKSDHFKCHIFYHCHDWPVRIRLQRITVLQRYLSFPQSGRGIESLMGGGYDLTPIVNKKAAAQLLSGL